MRNNWNIRRPFEISLAMSDLIDVFVSLSSASTSYKLTESGLKVLTLALKHSPMLECAYYIIRIHFEDVDKEFLDAWSGHPLWN
jgi:hypothetical protein